MAEVHGVLGRFLRMPREPDAPEFEVGPVGSGRRRVRKVPLRRPSATAPPGKDQTQNFAGVEDLQSGRSGRRRVGRGHALAGDIVLEPVERADKAAVAHAAAGCQPQFGAQMRTDRLGHTDASFPVAPHDNLFTQPGFLKQLLLLYFFAAGDEVPAFGKWRKQGEAVALVLTGCHEYPPSPGSKAAASLAGKALREVGKVDAMPRTAIEALAGSLASPVFIRPAAKVFGFGRQHIRPATP